MITDANLEESRRYFFERDKRYAPIDDKCLRMERIALDLITQEQQRRVPSEEVQKDGVENDKKH